MTIFRVLGRYVDPDTGGYQITEGNYRRIDGVLGRVYNLLATRRGSVPNAATFGSRLHTVTHLRPGVTREIERIVDEALRPYVGRWFKSYERACWLQNGWPLVSVTVKSEGFDDVLEIPLPAVS